MKYIKLIESLTNAKGAPGFEDEVIDVLKEFKGNYSLHKDNLKNAYLNLDKKNPELPTVMIDSHLDEVALMVRAIDDNGLLAIQTLGGWVPSTISAQQFLVRNKEGDYLKGICITKPIHFMTQEERKKTIEIKDLKIDIGATSRDEVIHDFKIEVGQPIVPATEFSYNEKNGVMMAKAFDNRIGAAVALAVMKELEDDISELPFNLVADFAAQEEVGLRGARVTAKRVQPDLAIVLEGTPSDDFTGALSTLQARLGQGPQIRHRDSSYIANEELIALFSQAAEEENIPVQHAVREGGGTNAGAIHLSNLGVPVATIGVPSRYVHTNASFCSYHDFEQTVQLIVSFLRRLKAEDFEQFGLLDL